MTTELTDLQRLVAAAYCGGEFAGTAADFRDCGDTLFRFAMEEAGGMADVQGLRDALETAIGDLQGVLFSLEDSEDQAEVGGTAIPLADRYAHRVIASVEVADSIAGIEVTGVRRRREGGTLVEDNARPDFFSVIALVPGSRAAVGDFASADAAREYAVAVRDRYHIKAEIRDRTR